MTHKSEIFCQLSNLADVDRPIYGGQGYICLQKCQGLGGHNKWNSHGL